jgi:hypothetical protein
MYNIHRVTEIDSNNNNDICCYMFILKVLNIHQDPRPQFFTFINLLIQQIIEYFLLLKKLVLKNCLRKI